MYSSNQIHCIQENTKIYGPKAYNNLELLNAILNQASNKG